jgi:dihydrofolate reductase/thymidylate synthase
MNTSIIVCVDKNGGISKGGLIPWKIKEDMSFFIDVTKRKYVKNLPNLLIMGKNTWLSCKDTLKDRDIIVVSSTHHSDPCVFPTLVEAFNVANKRYENNEIGHIFICGGSRIYQEALNYNINTIYLTTIDYDYECDNTITLNINDYNTFSTNTFNLVDLNDEKQVNVSFQKLYLKLPDHWKWCEERQYLDLLNDVLTTGDFRQTRNSKTWSKFGKNLEFDLSKGIPLFTTRKSFFKGIAEELFFFLKGDTNSKYLEEKGINIWTGNSTREFLDSMGLNHYEVGTIGNMYGYQWNHFGYEYQGPEYDYTNKGFNQLNYCINLLKTDPHSRRIMMTTLDPSTADQGVLRPCHSIILQFYVEKNNRLSMSCYNRSQDLFLGTNFNSCSSSLLIYLFCHIINNDVNYHGPKFTPGRLIMNLGDCHIYEDHKSMVIRQILRDPYPFPQLKINRTVPELIDFKFEDLELINYQCYPNIVAKMVA